ncbi:hypothetical protein [Methylorubrum extorquens]|uniref:hypothetical protein n=1 Tax=Methylorubrum extorquens TaxID=408 RepID=UPI001FCA4A4C|nr:hypothetical protein [Methylorubrum extorquens]MCP1545262.1 hypothetical protein [Methylorubrum extorquens]MCP1587391.1 hypothetical protein [Methylorubrum extorquens]
MLALLSSLPIIAMQSEGAEQRRASQADPVSNADPVPRLFAVFQAFLDRHAAAIATRDGIEAALVDRIGWPRVALLGGSDSEPRYPAELAEIARAMPPGRRRQRLEQRLRRRQRRWDEATATVGLAEADLQEATLDGALLAAAQALLATPAWTSQALGLKLLVLLSVHAPGPASDETSPWRELRLILADLGRLTASEGAVG